MQTAEHLNFLPALPALDKVRALVNDNLWGDWIIRVEYGCRLPGSGPGWQQWGEPLFPVSSADPVLEAILACRAAHPEPSIRISAQKVRPETRLVYWVHRADQPPALEDRPIREVLSRPRPEQGRPPSVVARLVASPTTTFR